jgi:hypothetical protein
MAFSCHFLRENSPISRRDMAAAKTGDGGVETFGHIQRNIKFKPIIAARSLKEKGKMIKKMCFVCVCVSCSVINISRSPRKDPIVMPAQDKLRFLAVRVCVWMKRRRKKAKHLEGVGGTRKGY